MIIFIEDLNSWHPKDLVNALTARRQKKIPTLRYANANHPPPYPAPHIFW